MPTKQGDLSLLNDPVAQELLNAPIPAHLSYVWTDGSPRVIPIGFTWTGSELVTGTPHNAPKMLALKDGQPVAAAAALHAGVEVTLESWPGMIHGWHGLANAGVPEAQAAWGAIRRYADARLGRNGDH